MEIAKRRIGVPYDSPVHVYFLGDTHIGNSTTNERAILRAVDIIKEDAIPSYLFLMGDYCDFITHTGDHRFDPREIMQDFSVRDLRNLPQAEADRFLGFMDPIKDKVLGIIEGNHESAYTKHNTFDIYKYICDHFPDAARLKEFAFFKLILDNTKNKNKIRIAVDFVLRHGAGGYSGSTKGYPMNKVIKVFNGQEGDIHVMGHIHRMSRGYITYTRMNNLASGTVTGRRFYGVNGAFLDSYVLGETNYSEARGGEPITKGMLVAEIKPHLIRMHGKRMLSKGLKLEEIIID